MRKELVIVLVVLVGGAFVVYNSGGTSPLTFRSARGVVNVETGQEAVDSKPKQPPQIAKPDGAGNKPNDIRATSDTGGASKEARKVSPPAITIVQVPADHPFPNPESFKMGSTGSEIRAAFGEPTMDIAGTRNGRFRERFYYVSKDGAHLTVATVENGALVSAEGLSNPYLHLPAASKGE
jgi:hypothetical protein